jgi:hypothetical protein
MPDVTITFINRQQEHDKRVQTLANLSCATVQEIVDMIEGQIGVVVSVEHAGHNLYRPRKPS